MNFRFALLACLALSAACETHAPRTDMTAPPDLLPPGDMATPFPAVMSPDVPQVQAEGGPVMTAPKVVVITFPGENHLADIEKFVSTLGDQSYWATATGEYGVGKITMITSIQDPTAPAASITDMDIQNYLNAKLTATSMGTSDMGTSDLGTPDMAPAAWPAPDDNTIYALFYPSTTTIDDGSGAKSCTDFGGYHADAALTTSTTQRIIYAVLPRCTNVSTNDPSQGDFGYLTAATSHEFMEASEDPFPLSNPAYADTDDLHFMWEIALGGGETGDLCAQNPDADFQPTGFNYWVQRNWSNAAASAAKNPCVPSPDATYASITPTTAFDDIIVGGGGFSTKVDGFEVQVGVPRTIELELFSDKPLAAPLTVKAIDFTAYENSTKSKLQMDWDTNTGVNGSKLHLTITASALLGGHNNTTTILVSTTSAGVPRYWFTLIKSVPATTPLDAGAPADM